jgi:hypothetical protein
VEFSRFGRQQVGKNKGLADLIGQRGLNHLPYIMRLSSDQRLSD